MIWDPPAHVSSISLSTRNTLGNSAASILSTMSVDVMFQPYSSYLYHQASMEQNRKKFGWPAMQDSLENFPRTRHSSTTQNPGLQASSNSGVQSVVPVTGLASSGPSSSGLNQLKTESDLDKDSEPKDTQYISANCIMFTYVSGDISSIVDEHFSRALSQPCNYSNNKDDKSVPPPGKGASSMAQRNFPASFWNQHVPAGVAHHYHDLAIGGGSSDPYGPFAASLHSMGGLHHQDPWHYPLTSQSHSYGSHRSMAHDLSAYPSMASSRFAPHYSSLLMQQSVRAGRLGVPGDLNKPSTDTWGARFHQDPYTPHMDTASTSGLETSHPVADVLPSKDLYWF